MENQISTETPKKKHFPVIIILAVVAVGVSAYLLMRPATINDKQVVLPTGEQQTPVASATPASSVLPSPTPSSVTGSVKTFTVVGDNYSFSLKQIKVNMGDTVKIVFQNDEGMHNWVIDEFNARTPVIQAGQKSEIEFVVDKVGTFQYYCSVGSHRANGMWGNLIVQ